MLIKATMLGVFVASTPLYFIANQDPQDPGQDGEQTTVTVGELEALQQRHAEEIQQLEEGLADEMEHLRGAHAVALSRADDATARAENLAAQLDECMGFLLEPRRRSNSCRPSVQVSKYYQWMRKNGHDERAGQALDQYVKQLGNNNSHLNSTVWHLMTDKRVAGQYDELALALAERMEEKGGLDHRMLDTVALAKFLNGHIDEAITLQKKAMKHGGRSDDYRRRLRTYEAAKKAAEANKEPEADQKSKAQPNEPAKTEQGQKKKKRKISDDE